MTINKNTREMFLKMLDQKIEKAQEEEMILRDLHQFALLSFQEYKALERLNCIISTISYSHNFLSHELVQEKNKVVKLLDALDLIQNELKVLDDKLPKHYTIEARFPDENLRNDHIGVNGVIKLVRENKHSGAFRIVSNFCANYFGEEIYLNEFNQFNYNFIEEILN